MTDVQPVEGFHRHHRQKDRSINDPTNVLLVGPILHDWIEKHPDEARELGWWVDSWQDPADVPVAIPDKLPTEKPRKKREKGKEKARNRAVVSIRVPNDEKEDGAGILDDLLDQARQRLAPVLGLEDDVPVYYVLVPALTDWLTGRQDEDS